MILSKDEEIIARGYEPYPKTYQPPEILPETLSQLEQTDVVRGFYHLKRMKPQEALKDSRLFLNHFFKLHKVITSSSFKIGRRRYDFLHPINPYKIPVGYVEDHIFHGDVAESLTPEYKPRIIFRGIILNKPTTEFTSTAYVHELTHVQLDSVRGSIKNYYNAEVISIFMELVHSCALGDHEKILRLCDSRRVNEAATLTDELIAFHKGELELKREDQLDIGRYLISELQAYNLFITYYFSNYNIRCEMLRDIQIIFDGLLSVEDILKKYDVTLENSQEPKRLIKYFARK